MDSFLVSILLFVVFGIYGPADRPALPWYGQCLRADTVRHGRADELGAPWARLTPVR